MAKTKLTLSIEEDKIKELKIKAINAGMTLSDLMSISASEVDPNRITKAKVIKQE